MQGFELEADEGPEEPDPDESAEGEDTEETETPRKREAPTNPAPGTPARSGTAPPTAHRTPPPKPHRPHGLPAPPPPPTPPRPPRPQPRNPPTAVLPTARTGTAGPTGTTGTTTAGIRRTTGTTKASSAPPAPEHAAKRTGRSDTARPDWPRLCPWLDPRPRPPPPEAHNRAGRALDGHVFAKFRTVCVRKSRGELARHVTTWLTRAAGMSQAHYIGAHYNWFRRPPVRPPPASPPETVARRPDGDRKQEEYRMCGITGWISFDRDLRAAADTLDAMTETMSCRGPDDRGTWIERTRRPRTPPAGHHRPARRPPADDRRARPTAPSPSSTRARRTTTPSCASELAGRGHRFTTDSDTEVVLRGYLEWGEAVAERLNGMYAFAIWDGRHDKLVMIRDRMGIKPFYYYETPDGVLFGSEPKAILANPLARRARHPRRPARAVRLRQDARPRRLGRHARGRARHGRHRRPRPACARHVYWRWRPARTPTTATTTIAHVRELLDDIVRRQLVADVPRCTLLSGGLDSSAMTALAARQLGRGRRDGPQLRRRLRRPDRELRRRRAARHPRHARTCTTSRSAAGTDHRDIVLDSHAPRRPRGARAG